MYILYLFVYIYIYYLNNLPFFQAPVLAMPPCPDGALVPGAPLCNGKVQTFELDRLDTLGALDGLQPDEVLGGAANLGLAVGKLR